MSVEFTESFMRFQRRTLNGTELNDDLAAGGFVLRSYAANTAYPPTTPNTGVAKWQVDADPVYAARNAVSVASPTTLAFAAAVMARLFDAPMTHYFIGMRMRLSVSPSVTPHYFIVGSSAMSKTKDTADTVNVWDTLLSIDIVGGTLRTGISGTLQVIPSYTYNGGDVYIEAEIDTVSNRVRIWLDDLLILDSSFGAGILAAAKARYDVGSAIGYFKNASSTTTVSLFVRDMYTLKVDSNAPFARLGATTQVIGELPDTDVQADFVRPAGYASNADVAALPVVPNPSVYLTGDTVGDEDRYTYSDSSVAAQAALVHAVGVKATIANFAAASHEISAVVKAGSVTGVESVGTLAPASGFVNKSAYFETNPETGLPWTPAEAQASEFGLRITS